MSETCKQEKEGVGWHIPERNVQLNWNMPGCLIREAQEQ